MAGYDFDPEKEPATVQIEMNPRRYVRINGETYCRQVTDVPMREVGADGTINMDSEVVMRQVVDEASSKTWVPLRIAQDLIMQDPQSAALGSPPMARKVGDRTVEEANASLGIVKEEAKPPARRAKRPAD